MANWNGKTNASLLGVKIFVFILNHLGLKISYFFLRFVALYYFLFSFKSNKNLYFYFHQVLKYKKLTTLLKMYKNYYILGQTILDKVALLAGVKTKFTINHDGGKNLDKLAANGKGGILISAHLGNWEIAGQLLNRLNTNFNILMYENEKENIKKFMDEVEKKKNVKIIAIKDNDMGHIIELHNAFSNNELVVMHGDRFREQAQTVEAEFLGKKAKFPAGPFILAARFGVPISIVFAVKESSAHYHFFASDPIEVNRTRTEEQTASAVKILLSQYIHEVEKMVHKYPEQWFNYFPFWKEQQGSAA
jgi:predicted LPLAT superfamily acyltransferase